MESEGAVPLFLRSKKNLGLIYKKYVRDRDSSSYSVVKAAQPCGCQDFIEKVDCISYFTKCIGTGLREVVCKNKGKLISLKV